MFKCSPFTLRDRPIMNLCCLGKLKRSDKNSANSNIAD